MNPNDFDSVLDSVLNEKSKNPSHERYRNDPKRREKVKEMTKDYDKRNPNSRKIRDLKSNAKRWPGGESAKKLKKAGVDVNKNKTCDVPGCNKPAQLNHSEPTTSTYKSDGMPKLDNKCQEHHNQFTRKSVKQYDKDVNQHGKGKNVADSIEKSINRILYEAEEFRIEDWAAADGGEEERKKGRSKYRRQVLRKKKPKEDKTQLNLTLYRHPVTPSILMNPKKESERRAFKLASKLANQTPEYYTITVQSPEGGTEKTYRGPLERANDIVELDAQGGTNYAPSRSIIQGSGIIVLHDLATGTQHIPISQIKKTSQSYQVDPSRIGGRHLSPEELKDISSVSDPKEVADLEKRIGMPTQSLQKKAVINPSWRPAKQTLRPSVEELEAAVNMSPTQLAQLEKKYRMPPGTITISNPRAINAEEPTSENVKEGYDIQYIHPKSEEYSEMRLASIRKQMRKAGKISKFITQVMPQEGEDLESYRVRVSPVLGTTAPIGSRGVKTAALVRQKSLSHLLDFYNFVGLSEDGGYEYLDTSSGTGQYAQKKLKKIVSQVYLLIPKTMGTSTSSALGRRRKEEFPDWLKDPNTGVISIDDPKIDPENDIYRTNVARRIEDPEREKEKKLKPIDWLTDDEIDKAMSGYISPGESKRLDKFEVDTTYVCKQPPEDPNEHPGWQEGMDSQINKPLQVVEMDKESRAHGSKIATLKVVGSDDKDPKFKWNIGWVQKAYGKFHPEEALRRLKSKPDLYDAVKKKARRMLFIEVAQEMFGVEEYTTLSNTKKKAAQQNAKEEVRDNRAKYADRFRDLVLQVYYDKGIEDILSTGDPIGTKCQECRGTGVTRVDGSIRKCPACNGTRRATVSGIDRKIDDRLLKTLTHDAKKMLSKITTLTGENDEDALMTNWVDALKKNLPRGFFGDQDTEEDAVIRSRVLQLLRKIVEAESRLMNSFDTKPVECKNAWTTTTHQSERINPKVLAALSRMGRTAENIGRKHLQGGTQWGYQSFRAVPGRGVGAAEPVSRKHLRERRIATILELYNEWERTKGRYPIFIEIRKFQDKSSHLEQMFRDMAKASSKIYPTMESKIHTAYAKWALMEAFDEAPEEIDKMVEEFKPVSDSIRGIGLVTNVKKGEADTEYSPSADQLVSVMVSKLKGTAYSGMFPTFNYEDLDRAQKKKAHKLFRAMQLAAKEYDKKIDVTNERQIIRIINAWLTMRKRSGKEGAKGYLEQAALSPRVETGAEEAPETTEVRKGRNKFKVPKPVYIVDYINVETGNPGKLVFKDHIQTILLVQPLGEIKRNIRLENPSTEGYSNVSDAILENLIPAMRRRKSISPDDIASFID